MQNFRKITYFCYKVVAVISCVVLAVLQITTGELDDMVAGWCDSFTCCKEWSRCTGVSSWGANIGAWTECNERCKKKGKKGGKCVESTCKCGLWNAISDCKKCVCD